MIGIYLNRTATLVSRSFDSWQEPTEAEAEIRCRIDWKSKMTTDREGNNVASQATVLLAPDQPVDHDMIFRYNSKDYGILSIEEVESFSLLFKQILIA